jgi:hypothetical protein
MITLVCKKCHKPIGDTCCCKKEKIEKIRDDVVKVINDSKATFFCADEKQSDKLAKEMNKCQEFLYELKAEITTNVEMYFIKRSKPN